MASRSDMSYFMVKDPVDQLDADKVLFTTIGSTTAAFRVSSIVVKDGVVRAYRNASGGPVFVVALPVGATWTLADLSTLDLQTESGGRKEQLKAAQAYAEHQLELRRIVEKAQREETMRPDDTMRPTWTPLTPPEAPEDRGPTDWDQGLRDLLDTGEEN